MSINSNAKGKVGEREVAALLRARGFEARRGQQFSGGGDSPDVVSDLDGFHIEVKRTENFQLYPALAQANADKKGGTDALVFHRRNNKEWVVVLEADVFLNLLDEHRDLLNEYRPQRS